MEIIGFRLNVFAKIATSWLRQKPFASLFHQTEPLKLSTVVLDFFIYIDGDR